MFTKLNPVKSIVIIAVLEEDIKVQGKGSHLAKVTHYLINGSEVGTRGFP